MMGGCILMTQAMADLYDISSIQEAKPYLEKVDQNSLVLFDVDYVLTQPSEPSFQMKNIRLYKEIWKDITGNLSTLENNISSTLIAISSPSILIENKMISVINTLNERKIKVLALTGILTGKLGKIQSIEKWRYNTLKKLGFVFSSSFDKISDATFSSLPSCRGNYPVFYKGVLFSNGDANKVEKGRILRAFLALLKEKYNWSPTFILFIDDRENNLKDIEAVCASFTPPIQFTGLLYKGARDYPSIPVDEKDFKSKWEIIIAKTKAMAIQKHQEGQKK